LPFPQPGPIEPAPVTIAVFPVRSSTVLYLPTPISLMAVGGYHENPGRIGSQSQCSKAKQRDCVDQHNIVHGNAPPRLNSPEEFPNNNCH
jgi:hypothetical protein